MGRLWIVMAIVSITVSGCGVFVEGPWGEWTDTVTGYTWQDTPAGDTMTWQGAIDYCNNLRFDGHSDWRLPTISELRSLIRGCPATEAGGSCGVTDSCLSYSSCWNDPCSGCSGGGPAGGCYWPDGMKGPCSYYWSSSEREDLSYNAWFVGFNAGSVDSYGKVNRNDVRCVR